MAGALNGTELVRTPYFRLSCDYAQRIVILERTPLPFQRLEDVEAATAALAAALPPERRKGFAMLGDFRNAPLRVTAALEPAFARFRNETERGFTQSVLVIATVVGRARTERLKPTSVVPLSIVESMEEAVALLVPAPSRPPQ